MSARAGVWVMALSVVAPVQASLRVGGIVDVAHAIETEDGRAQKSELTVLPVLEWRSPWGIDWTAVGRLRADAVDRLEPQRPEQRTVGAWSRRMFAGDDAEAELREFYAEAYWGDHYLRLGKQQIVWGQSDGLKVLDRVNPQSFREFILDDFEDSRIPLWSVKWEVPVGDRWLAQWLLIIDQTYHQLPGESGAYAFDASEFRPMLAPDEAVLSQQFDKPDRPLRDADVGTQWSARFRGWDVTFNYLFHYADQPVVRVLRTEGGVHIQTAYERTQTVGATASNAFGDFTLRTELGYTTDRYVFGHPASSDDGVVRGGELAYVVGVDWMGLRDTLVSAQFFQSGFDRGRSAVRRRSIETDATLLLERTFMNDVIKVGGLLIHDIDRGDGLISPAVSFDYRANLIVRFEADVFYGNEDGRYGQFDHRDRLVVGVEYGF